MSKASYWSQDVSKLVEIGTSTLRRWSLEMEKQGYTFEKDENGRRRFSEQDLNAIRAIKQLSEDGSTIEEAIRSIITGPVREDMLGRSVDEEREKLSDQLALIAQTQQSAIEEMRSENQAGFIAMAQEIGALRKQIEEMQKELAATTEKKPRWKFW